MKKYSVDLISLLIFIILTAGFFYPVILQGKLPVPSDSLVGLYHPWRDLYAGDYPRGIPFKNFLITDPVRQQIPWRKVAVDQWKSGKIPVWNPFNFAGTPLAANIQAAVFYPLNLLFLLFSFPTAWTVLIMLGPLLSGIFLYLYLRTLRMNPLTALLGSIVWSFSGFNIAWLTWGTITQAALWLPAILLAVEKITDAGKTGRLLVWSALLIFFSAMTVFAGHAQVAFYVLALSTVYILWKLRANYRPKKYAVLLSSLIVSFIITSIQWLPLIKLMLTSGRFAEINYLKDGWFLPWQNLVQFIVPDFFGNPTTLNYWGIWNYGEFIGFIGVVPLVFIIYTFLSKKSRPVIFWLTISLISLLLMLPSPLSIIPFVLSIPIISTLQPTRLMVILDFSLVMLAAYGISSWLETKDNKIRISLAVISLIILSFWLTVVLGNNIFGNREISADLNISRKNLILPTVIFIITGLLFLSQKIVKPINKKICIALLTAVVVFDLFRFGWKFTPFTEPKYLFPASGAIRFLQAQSAPFRIMSVDKEILPPNTGSYFGLETVEGYDPLFSGRFEEFMAALERGKPDISPPFGFNRIVTLQNLDSPLVPLLNVRYILSLSDLKKSYLKKVFQEGKTRIYEDSRTMPRAFFVSKLVSATGKVEIINLMFDPAFDLKTTAVVEKPNLLSNTGYDGLVKFATYGVDRLELSTVNTQSQYLVVTNSYDDCWKARIDGVRTSVYRTDYELQGLEVPAGSHIIELRCEI